MSDDVDSALRLQTENRLRAKARSRALSELAKAHPEEYAALYLQIKKELQEKP